MIYKYRFIISFLIFISILSCPISVFAQSTDEISQNNIDSVIEEYKTKIKNETIDFFETYNVEVNSIDSLWDTFIASWKITKASAYYGKTYAQLVAGLIKDFIQWLRDDYFYGYFEDDTEIHYISPEGKLPSHKKPSGHTTSSHLSEETGLVGWIQDYHGDFPIQATQNKENYMSQFFLSQVPEGNMFDNIQIDSPCGVVRNSYEQNKNYDHMVRAINVFSTPDLSNISLSSGQFVINLWNSIAGNYSMFQKFAVCHIDSDFYLNIDSVFQTHNTIYSTQKHEYNNNNYEPIGDWIYTNESTYAQTTTPSTPFYMVDKTFYCLLWGNGIYKVDSTHCYFYYNGLLYNLADYNNSIPDFYGGERVSFGGRDLNLTIIDNGITNYNTVINNVVNNNTDIDPDLLIYILNDYLSQIINGLDLSEYLTELNNRLEQLENDLNDMKDDILNIKSTLVKVKNYLKNIDLNVTRIINRIDSLFIQSGVFIIDSKLDYVYNGLTYTLNYNTNRIVSALENISVSSNGGDINIDFSDYFIDFDASLNLLFSLNNEQKAELESDIETMKAPFSWIASFGNNINNLIKSMVARSALYSGDSYSGDFSSLDNVFDSSLSDNAADPPGKLSSSVPSGSAPLSSGSQAPQIIMHFGNANSNINYGGDAVVLSFDWYAPYKNIVDRCIVVFAWAFFIIYFYRHIPSFLNGEDSKKEGD